MKNLILAIATLAFSAQVNASTITLRLEVEGLEPMKGQHYEGWNIVDGKPLSTGRFSITKNDKIFMVDRNGRLKSKVGSHGAASFKVDRSHLNATVFVLTIEPNGDSDNGPSDIHVMGGDYNSHNIVDLSIGHGSSIGNNFSDASGGFILAATWLVETLIAFGLLTLLEVRGLTLPTRTSGKWGHIVGSVQHQEWW
ncbi:MAG: hypothetical protein R3B45_16945 [Bdellovibrionota bacterium]